MLIYIYILIDLICHDDLYTVKLFADWCGVKGSSDL